MALVIVAAVAVGVVLWVRHDTGPHWDDVDIGQCVRDVPQAAVVSMTGSSRRTPDVPCDDPSAAYVVVSRSTTATDLTRWSEGCPDPSADAVGSGRVREVSWSGRGTDATETFGLMCLAPVLHEGRCYDTDRGLGVRAAEACLPSYRRVTRRIPGVADLGLCSPRTGLALTRPEVTYCESTVAPPAPLGADRSGSR